MTQPHPVLVVAVALRMFLRVAVTFAALSNLAMKPWERLLRPLFVWDSLVRQGGRLGNPPKVLEPFDQLLFQASLIVPKVVVQFQHPPLLLRFGGGPCLYGQVYSARPLLSFGRAAYFEHRSHLCVLSA